MRGGWRASGGGSFAEAPDAAACRSTSGGDSDSSHPLEEDPSMAKTGKKAASNAGKTLDQKGGKKSKTAAGSALSQTGNSKVTSKGAASAASKTMKSKGSSKAAKSAAGSALAQKPAKKSGKKGK